MASTLGSILLKGLGVFVVLLVALAIIGTILSLVVGLVATVVSALVVLAFLALFVLAAVGLASLVRGGDDEAVRGDATESWMTGQLSEVGIDGDEPDPRERLRERYVAGEIDESDFERKLDLLLETEDAEAYLDGRSTGHADSSRTRDKLWER